MHVDKMVDQPNVKVLEQAEAQHTPILQQLISRRSIHMHYVYKSVTHTPQHKMVLIRAIFQQVF